MLTKHFQKKPGSYFPRQQQQERNVPGMGAVCPFHTQLLPASLLWFVGRLLSLPSLSLCYPLISPPSISFAWLDFGLQSSFALYSSSFSASSLSPFIYQSVVATSQSGTGAANKRAPRLPQTTLEPQTPFLRETVGSKSICSSRLSAEPSSYTAPQHQTSAACCYSCKSRD